MKKKIHSISMFKWGLRTKKASKRRKEAKSPDHVSGGQSSSLDLALR